MANTDTTPKVREAQGIGAWARGALHPAIIINPAASKNDLMHWAMAELQSLHQWLDLLACSKCDIVANPCDIALMVTDRLGPLLQGFEAAFEGDKAQPQPGTV